MFSLFRFLLNQENSFPIIFLVFELTESLTILFCITHFFLKYYLDSENKNIFDTLINFSEKLTLGRKIVFFFFIFTFAIPNKIIVNNKLNLVSQILINFGMMIVCSLFPLFFFIFAVRVKFAFESYMFGYICTYIPWLRIIVVKYLFNGDEAVATIVFAFFWGNMVNAAKNTFKSMGVATVGAVGYRAIKASEEKNIESETIARTDRDWDRLMKDPRRAEISQEQSGKTGIQELQTIKDNAREEAIQTTTLTAFEHNFKKSSLVALDVFMKKYS